MSDKRVDKEAFGHPGQAPSWAHGDKDGIGTAYSVASRLWFTLWKGIVTEIYFPTVDRPQTRDLQYLFSDGQTFVHDEIDLETKIERIDVALGYRVTGHAPDGRYRYEKEIIADPHAPCLLQRTRVYADGEVLRTLRLYVLLAPHLHVSGWGNTGSVYRFSGRNVLIAERPGIALAMMATVPFSKASVGFVGASDGWTDLHRCKGMEWQFDRATDGNIALTGEIDLSQSQEFTLGVAFGNTPHRAVATLAQSLAFPFDDKRDRFVEQWTRTHRSRESLEDQAGDGGELYRTSVKLLLAHEDKLYPGAMIASLAIPWGEAKDDAEGQGGYHLVWTRDMVQSAMGLLAAGNTETPLRALIYLATSQLQDGSFPQNFWVEGGPFWRGIQLDEVAFPIVLAHRLWKEGGLLDFDPIPMVRAAAGFLLREGPTTRQERWEEAGGFSPSTLAVMIAALICAADFARSQGREEGAHLVEQYADWLEHNLETWTVTRDSKLLPGVPRHYVRLAPSQPGTPLPDDGVEQSVFELTSQPPGQPTSYPAKEIVDAGFLELVRYGIRRADDPVIVDSLKVVDALLRVETPSGTAWRRYNHDGYGQRADGAAYAGWGQGRAWPLLTGERGHYEVAAGRPATEYIRWMEGLATPTNLIPEQSWDTADAADGRLRCGRPTGSAVPLLWAHAEYIRLLRSARDGRVFDSVPEVEERYQRNRPAYANIQFWSFATPATRVGRGHTLRLMTTADFEVTYWLEVAEAQKKCATGTAVGVYFVDIPIPQTPADQLHFTFYWLATNQWEGRDFSVALHD